VSASDLDGSPLELQVELCDRPVERAPAAEEFANHPHLHLIRLTRKPAATRSSSEDG